MKKKYFKKILYCAIVLNLLFLYENHAQNKLTRVLDASVSGSDLNVGDCTPVTTFNDIMYISWIDGTTLKLAQHLPDGTSTETVIRENIQDDKYHVMPSITLDKDGYIHVAADVHNQDWIYYVSDAPESIASFTKYEPGSQRCPPGDGLTYPEFFKDVNDVLYVTFRHQTKYEGEVAGKMGGAIARYDVQSKSWTMLGGTSHGGNTTMVWANGGASRKGFYQKPLIRLFWDSSNRMHMSATVAVENVYERSYGGMTDVIYAYSDDGGNSWNKVDGTPIISLPLTRNNASVIENRSNEKDIISGARVVAFDRNSPVVGYQVDEGPDVEFFMKMWNGTEWVEIDAPFKSRSLYARRNGKNGEVVVFRPYTGFYMTRDRGQTWELLRSDPSEYSGSSEEIDYEHYISTGDFRWRSVDRNTYDVNFYTYDRDEPAEGEPFPILDKVSSMNTPNIVVPGETATVTVDYTAPVDRDLFVALQLSEPPYTTYGKTRISAPKSSIDELLTVQVAIEVSLTMPLASDIYQWSSYLVPVGKDYPDRRSLLRKVGVSAATSAFEIGDYAPPTNLVLGESYAINIPYSGTGPADIQVSLQNRDDNWSTEGFAKVSVEGNGTAILNVTVDSGATPGANYHWQAYITPVGGNWGNRYDNKQITGINVTNVTATEVFDIQNYVPPTSVVPGQLYTINVPYTGNGLADVQISLQNRDTNWSTEGFARTSVNGSGTATLNVTVNSDAALGANYHWQAYITPAGGSWSNRYDNELINGINCISNANLAFTIPEVLDENIYLHPNPVDDLLFLNLEGSKEDIQQITLYDLQGRIAKQLDKSSLVYNGELSLDVSVVPEGMYILSLDFAQKETQKLQIIVKH